MKCYCILCKGVILLIHIGMHKCASTTIQQLTSMSKESGLVQFYNEDFRNIEKIFTRYIISSIDDPEDVLTLKNFFLDKKFLSTEGLCGQLFDIYSGFYLHVYPKKLLKIMPQIDQINLVLRDPVELLYSMYKNDIQMGVQLSVHEWVELLKNRNWITLIKPQIIYDEYKHICREFKIFDFNKIIKLKPNELDVIFFNGLLNFKSNDISLTIENKGQSFFSTNIQRNFVNQFFKTKHSKLHHIGKANTPFYNFYRYKFSKLMNFISMNFMEKSSYFKFSKIIQSEFSNELMEYNKFFTDKKIRV